MTYHKNSVVVGRPKMSLDLELNLSPSYSPPKTTTKIEKSINHKETVSPSNGKNLTSPSKKNTLSWLSFDGGDEVDHKEQEMVTKVCMKCHMLSTSTPVCPNCKFMHPHDHSLQNCSNQICLGSYARLFRVIEYQYRYGFGTVDDYSFRESQKEGETRREVEELRRNLAMEKKRMNRIKLCSSMELLLLLVVLVLLLSTFVLVFFLSSP
ncbi:hypothetical protein F2Q70_00016392 [Brassica cretica]|uniref:Uncharacterized protein n=1 Tax=Brassica cretica TaxID=69181 RepID=A0A8S9HST7_BRACR|nr:hypothetical protein F2Q70_00016392 [Brassica cretica]KAF2596309.1 hypothetical protein F2Q68_00009358 [Brassica cretica]